MADKIYVHFVSYQPDVYPPCDKCGYRLGSGGFQEPGRDFYCLAVAMDEEGHELDPSDPRVIAITGGSILCSRCEGEINADIPNEVWDKHDFRLDMENYLDDDDWQAIHLPGPSGGIGKW